MKMDKKLLVLLLVVTLFFTFVFVGYGEDRSSFKADLRILWPGTSAVEKELAFNIQEKVKAEYPGINIEYIFLNWSDIEKKLAIMINAGDYPDLMQIQDATNPVAMDALEPLGGYLTDKINEDMFVGASWNCMKVDDVVYGIPALAILYSHVANTDLLKEVGYNVSDLKTWDDVIEASHLIKATGKYGYAMANGGTGRFTFRDFMMVCLSNGITPDQVDDAHKKQYLEVLNLFKELSSDMPKSQITWLYPDLFKAWEAGDVGIMHTGSYFTSNVLDHGKKAMDRTVPFVFPTGPSVDKPHMMVGAVGMSIIKGSENKEAAWKVIEIIMTPEILGQWGGALHSCAGTYVDSAILENASKKVYPEVYKQHTAMIKKWSNLAVEYGIPIPKILGQAQMEVVLQGAMIKMLDGEITVIETYNIIRTGIEKVKASFK
jgi:ABC-type glycerol-3-phosphate transport system substrate-binding protein